MQIQIKAEDANDIMITNFVYNYLPEYIYRLFINNLNSQRLALFDQTFKIDSFSILKYALKHLLITRTKDDTFIIKIDKTIKYKGHMLMDYITLITYGTREIRGYSIVLDIFKEVTKNMNGIYNAWLLGIK